MREAMRRGREILGLRGLGVASRAVRVQLAVLTGAVLALYAGALGVGPPVLVGAPVAAPASQITAAIAGDSASAEPTTMVSVAPGADSKTAGAGEATEAAGAARGGARLAAAFDLVDFDLDAVRAGDPVPRLFLASLPADYHAIGEVERRKREFVRAVLPLVLKVNEEIMAERRRLLALAAKQGAGEALTEGERSWLRALARKYRGEPEDLDGLIVKVDTVSPALALTQAAIESGWGRSRFAREGNALFGQRTYSARQRGIAPSAVADDAGFKVRAFDRLLDGVRAYALNLDRHPAYARFRAARAEMRRAGITDPYRLVETLGAYSERGQEYTAQVARVMRSNALDALDVATLAPVDLAPSTVDALLNLIGPEPIGPEPIGPNPIGPKPIGAPALDEARLGGEGGATRPATAGGADT